MPPGKLHRRRHPFSPFGRAASAGNPPLRRRLHRATPVTMRPRYHGAFPLKPFWVWSNRSTTSLLLPPFRPPTSPSLISSLRPPSALILVPVRPPLSVLAHAPATSGQKPPRHRFWLLAVRRRRSLTTAPSLRRPPGVATTTTGSASPRAFRPHPCSTPSLPPPPVASTSCQRPRAPVLARLDSAVPAPFITPNCCLKNLTNHCFD